MIKEPDKLIEAAKIEKDKQFRLLCDEAIEKADKKLEERGQSYNKGGVYITDYGDSLEDPVKARFHSVWENALRLKSEVNSGVNPEDKIIDLINFTRFLYAALKMSIDS